jgi:hypothetical protein
MSKFLCVVALIILNGCGSDESQMQTDAGPDVDNIRPIQDIGIPEDDASTNPDPILTPDMGGIDMAPEPIDPCPGGCATGVTKCQGTQVQYCIVDPNNAECGIWDTAADCASPQQSCVGFQCEFPMGCVDNDGDGYGLNCANGPDCDDNAAARYPSATELCDNIDNDCDGDIDNGLNVGGTCTVGPGVCASTGVYICDASGQQVCMVTGAGMGTPEMCDGVDNDCDMLVDEDGVCDLCALDSNEPNDTVATATLLTMNVAKTGITCPADLEYFAIPTTPNKVYRVNINFFEAISDLDLTLLANGVVVKTAATTADYESLTFTASPNTTYVAQVINYGGSLNPFRIAVVDIIPCAYEDTFYPNGNRGIAAFLFPGWIAEGHVCNASAPTKLSDWYSLGTYQPGEIIDILLYDLDGYGDLDLFLVHDPDGDGTFTTAASSAFDGTDEYLTYTVTSAGPYYIEVRDYAGIGAFYELEYDER